MKPASIRSKLGLSRGQFARALGVNEITIIRWENGTSSPIGLHLEVMGGIEDALEDGADPKHAARMLIGGGVRTMICREIKATS